MIDASWRDTWRLLRRSVELLALAAAITLAAFIANVGRDLMQ